MLLLHLYLLLILSRCDRAPSWLLLLSAALCGCSQLPLLLSLTFHLPICSHTHPSVNQSITLDLAPMATMDNLANAITQIL